MYFVVLSIVTAALAQPVPAWTHGWDRALDAQFIDFGYELLTADQLQFIASHYRMFSMEKCTGPGATEPNVWNMAQALKAIDPSFKSIFYWDVDQTALGCYNAKTEYLANPSWWLRDDVGALFNSSGVPVMDYTNADARAWWVSVPLGPSAQYAGVIDGVLADGMGDACNFENINAARCNDIIAARGQMVQEFGALLQNANGGVVIANGLSFYHNTPDFNLGILADAGGVMVEHFAVFEQVLPSGALNVTLVHEAIALLQQIVALNKTVVVGTWPGQLVGFGNDGNPVWPNNSQPTDNAGWRAALIAKHTFALAAFLTVAESNVWMQYELWYSGTQGAYDCPEAPASCLGPSPWYPALYSTLGAPTGPAQRSNNIYTRTFANCGVILNLDDPDQSAVTFSTAVKVDF